MNSRHFAALVGLSGLLASAAPLRAAGYTPPLLKAAVCIQEEDVLKVEYTFFRAKNKSDAAVLARHTATQVQPPEVIKELLYSGATVASNESVVTVTHSGTRIEIDLPGDKNKEVTTGRAPQKAPLTCTILARELLE